MLRIVKLLTVAFCVPLALSMVTVASAQQEPADLFATVLISTDLQDAKRIMTIHDPNEDGFIDKLEQKRISWKSEIPTYDLNKDGKLTHLEVSVRQAKLRSDSGITFLDRKNASKFMHRNDRNGNNQLDPDEIALGWPKNPKAFDTDEDGIISLGEIATQFAANRGYRREVGIEGVDQTEAARLKNQLDRNNDGKLAADEWKAASLPGQLKQHDENGDGFLSVEEIATFLAKSRLEMGLSRSDQLRARQMVRRADLNQDGKVTAKEIEDSSSFNPGSKELLTYDNDKDGEVTLAEVEKSLAKERMEKGFSDEDFASARRLLTRHDVNRSNFIEKSELVEVAGAGQLSVGLMGKIDTSKDEKLSLQEIARHLAQKKK